MGEGEVELGVGGEVAGGQRREEAASGDQGGVVRLGRGFGPHTTLPLPSLDVFPL